MSRCSLFSLSRIRLQPYTTASHKSLPAIRILCRVFALSNITSGKPVTYPIRTLRGLYHGAHARGTLNDLSNSQFSAIISLFGTLSAHDPPSQFTSPLAQHMDKRSYRAWWGCIFQMVRDKKRVTGLLNDGDLYWLLRARTAEASMTALSVYAGDGVSNPRLLAVRERYLTIDIKTSPADDHVPYLKALLSEKKREATAEAVAWLCHLINRDIYCPPSLLAVLWECVLDSNNLLSDDLKEEILGLISQRLTLPTDFSEDARSRFASLLPESEVDDPEKHPSFCLTASDLAREVVRILFPRVTPSLAGTPSQLAIQEWAHSETQRMFPPSARLEFRWHNLICLALANTRSTTYTQTMIPTLRTINTPRLSAVNFKLVAVLAFVERIANSHGSSTDLSSSVRELWTSWVDIANNDSHAHRALVRPILGTFFRLAALTRDASLVHSCVRLASVGFWQFDLGDDVARRQAQLLAVEYLAAAAVSGDSLWERMVMELPPHITFPQWLSMLLSKTILRLVRLDAQRAMDVYHLWRRYLPVPDLSGPLGPMFVQEGRADLAIPMLSDINLTGPSLGAILQPLAKQGSWYIDLELAAIIAKALNSISVSEAPPQTTSARRHVAWALLALVCSAQARTAVTIFKNVYARDPGFFNGRVIRTFLSMLLRHRQFRGAAEIAKLSPRFRWRRRFVLLGLARRGSTPRVEAQLGGSVLPKWLVDVVAHTRLGRRHPAAGLLRRWATRRARTPADTRNGFKVLVRARGVGLARRAYRTARTLHNAGEQTALGNIILDGQVTHANLRGSRQLSTVLRTLRLLVEQHGFVPDRVTTNIVVKAALRSPTVLDVVLVRQLFDYFACSGYVGDGDDVPFGSSEAAMREAAAVLGTCTPVTKSKLSFARHVKPLHKMFIKALYLRKDVAGARRVVGILKEGERLEVERIARRRKTRVG